MYKVNFSDRIFEPTGEVNTTRVQIQEGMTTITRVLKGDLGSENDDRLIGLVLEQFYQETYPNRAENERFTKFDEKLKLMDKKLEEMDKVKKELEITQGSVMELITQLGDKLAKGDGQHEQAEKTQEDGKGGENNDGNVIRN
jgi:hypothetical protein